MADEIVKPDLTFDKEVIKSGGESLKNVINVQHALLYVILRLIKHLFREKRCFMLSGALRKTL